MNVRLALYGAGVSAVTPFLPVEPGTKAERLGLEVPRVSPRPFLLHAVSVGEVRAARAFVDALAARRPEARVVLTTGNRDGRDAAERVRARSAAVEAVSYLPWDRPRAVERWLAALAPACVAVVETEIWPGLFLGAQRLGIPLFVVNARLPEREAKRYRLLRGFFRPVLEAVTGIAAQTPADLDRFVSLGARPERTVVLGNLKFDAADPSASAEKPHTAPTLVAGSTHAPEERWLLAAFTSLRRSRPDLKLVLAPRHPHRAGAIAEEARRLGFDASAVCVVDRFGVLPGLYAGAAAAFIGGSLVPRGGQSPIEPAAAGIPIVMGPSDSSFREISRRLEEAGALLRIAPGAEPSSALACAFERLLADEDARVERGRKARRVFEEGRGAADATVTWLLDHLESSG